MPRSAKTGREKKLTREAQSAERKRIKASLPTYQASQKALQELQAGKGLPEADPSKILQTLRETEGAAKQYFEPHKQETLANFAQYQAPEVRNAYGANAGSRSSALNQALAASAANLHRQLNSDFQNLSLGLGQNIMDRQQRAQDVGLQTRLGAIQAGLQPQSSFAAQTALQPQYLPKGPPSNTGKNIIGGAAQGAIAGAPAGPWGAALGALGGGLGGWAGMGGGLGGSLAQFLPQSGGINPSSIQMDPRMKWSN